MAYQCCGVAVSDKSQSRYMLETKVHGAAGAAYAKHVPLPPLRLTWSFTHMVPVNRVPASTGVMTRTSILLGGSYKVITTMLIDDLT